MLQQWNPKREVSSQAGNGLKRGVSSAATPWNCLALGLWMGTSYAPAGALVERTMVLFGGGPHEAGDDGEEWSAVLAAKAQAEALASTRVFTVEVAG